MIYTFQKNKPHLNPVVNLRMGFCTAAILAVLSTEISPHGGAIHQNVYARTLQSLEAQDPLLDRVRPAPERLLKKFGKDLNVDLSAHVVTPAEQMILANALAQLTPFQRQILHERLHAIYFIDGLPNNALTFPDGGLAGKPMYSMAVRAGALQETISELVTQKERTLFDPTGSDLSVTVDAGTLNAMVYVLLHETTHIVDIAAGATPDTASSGGNHPLVDEIWRDPRTPVDQYRLPILMSILWRGGRAMPITRAGDLYDALSRTSFISVYASCDSHDDLAELVAWTELTGRLHQPYRILISNGTKVLRVIKPAQSTLVRARLKLMSQLTGRYPDL